MKKSLSKSSKKPVKRLKLDSSFLKIGPAAKTLGVSIDTLRRWEKSGKITAERTPGGTRLYHLSTLKKINPVSVEDFQTKGQTTEELLKRIEKDTILGYKDTTRTEGSPSIPVSQYPSIPTKSSLLTKFLIGSALFLTITLLLTSWITVSHFTSKNEPPPPVLVTQQPSNNSAVLAATSTSPFLEINSDTQINGLLSVRDSINGLTLEATPSAGTIALNAGTTTLTVTKDALLDQDVSTTATPGFNTLNLSATKDQLVLQSGGPTGTLTWTPTAARTITLPDATDTLVGKATTDTLTNKSISGSSNTLTNIPNSALSNSKVTVTAGTNLTGGGDITLGSSATIALKDSPSISGSFTIAGVVSLADGTAAAPALTFTNDTNTGLYRIGADNIALITGGTATSGITIDSSGNVGIADNTPSYKLDVTGTANVSSNLTVGGTGSFTSTLTASNGLTLTTGALSLTSTSGSAALTLSSSATAFNVQSGLFDIDTQSSRVGIGTASPGSTLNVIGNVGIGTSAAGAALQVNGGGLFGWGTASVAGPTDGLGISGNLGIGTTTANNKLQVIGAGVFGSDWGQYSAPASGLLVQGNVGIGATTSNNKLDVWGNSRLAGTLTVDSTSSFGGNLTLNSGQFLTPNGTASLPSYAFTNSTSTGIYSPSSNALALNTNGASTPPLTITAAGNVGIGVTAPTQLFQVNPTGPNSIVITSAGNVGIGTTSPIANLHVTGTSKFDGISTHGNVLPDADITYDLGSAAVRWNNAYVYTLTATNIAGVVTGGSTTSSDWMINANNTLDSANSTLTFKRGSPTNAVLQWYGNNNTFDFNSGIRIGVNNGSASTIESTTGLVLSGFANDITTGTNEHLSLIPNGTGNVGIGTSSPGALLGVLGGVNIGGGTSRFAEKAGPANGLAVEGNVGIGLTSPLAPLHVWGNNTNSAFFLNGNVGIGTISPTSGLNVYGTSQAASQLTLQRFDGSARSLILTPSSSSLYASVTTSSTLGLLLNTTGYQELYLNGSGNVGIGTTNPSYQLQTTGNVGIGGSLTVTSAATFSSTGTFTSTLTASNGLTLTTGALNLTSTSGQANLALSSNTNAFTINGLFGIDTTSGRVGIGTTAPQVALQVLGGNVGIGTSAAGAALQVNGGGLFGWGTASIAGPSNGLAISGNVGIGTTSFTSGLSGLQIQPAARTKTALLVTDSDGSSSFEINLGSGGQSTIYQRDAEGVIVNVFGTGGASYITGGNVGIGFTSPNALLHINGANQTTAAYGIQMGSDITLYRSAANTLKTDNNLVVGGTITGSGTQFLAANGTASLPSYSFSNLTNAGLWTNGDGLLLTTGGTNTKGIAVTGAGNVGIGVTNPVGALQVNGAAAIGYGSIPTSSLPSNGLAVSGNVGIGTTTPLAPLHVWGNNTDSAFFLNGNVGIGTISPTSGLNVYGTSQAASQLTIQRFDGAARSLTLTPASGSLYASMTTSSTQGLLFNTAGYQELYLNGSGNVGIGTTNPSYQLQTTGNVGIGGSLTVTSGTVLSGGLAVSGGSVILPAGSIQNSELENSSITVNATAGTGLSVSGSPVSLGGTLTIAGIDASTTVKGVASFNSTNFSVSSGAVNTIQDIATSATPTFVGLNTTSGNVGIGTSATGVRLAVNGTGLFGWGTASVAGPSNGLAVFGNVGIGTTSPTNPLTVIGNANIAGTLTTAGLTNTGTFLAANGTASLPSYSFSNLTNAGLWTNGDGLLLTAGGTNTKGITVTGAGNVGIGTTAPAFKLDVTDSALTYHIPARFTSPDLTYLTVQGTSQAYSWYRTTGGTHSWVVGSEVDGVGDNIFQISSLTNNANTDTAIASRRGGTATTALSIDYTTQNVGLGMPWANIPGATLQVNGNAMIGYSSGTPGSLSNGLAVSGNIGIGTTSPGALLDVGLAGTTLGTIRLAGNTSGNVTIQTAAAAGTWSLTLPTTDGDANQFLQTNGSGVTTWAVAGLPTGTSGQTLRHDGADWVANSLLFNNGTNVGIGMSAPDRLLHIAGTIDITSSLASLLGVSGTQFDISGATTNAAKKLVLGIDTTDNYGVIQAGNTDGTNYALSLNPAGGNVGIGTTSPLAALDIRNAMSIGTAGSNEGTITFRTTGAGETAPTVAASAGNLVLTTPTGWVNLSTQDGINVVGNTPSIWWTANSGNATFDFYGGSATTLSIKNTNQGTVNLSLPKGNIGIGTSATGAALQVNGGGLFGWGTAATSLSSGAIAAFNGNVGIGTTSPAYQLQTTGNVGIGGSLTVSSVLQATKLVSCNTIDTDSNGVFVCGTDAGASQQTFTADGTWTKPSGAIVAIVEAVGGGGGGGGGPGAAAANSRAGGGGGGGGAITKSVFQASALGATESVTVGAAGTAGTAGSSADGTAGGVGGNSIFGSYVTAYGGGGGQEGASGYTTRTGGGGGGTGGAGTNGASGGAGGDPQGSTTDKVGGTGGDGSSGTKTAEFGGGGGGNVTSINNGVGGGNSIFAAGGGGGGGGVNSSNVEGAGGTGGAHQHYGGGAAGGAGGTVNGNAGTAGTTRTYGAGDGGGGGGGQDSGTAGAGAAGGAPGGGGGGGGGGTTVGGAGGAGGRGEVRVWTVTGGTGADLAEVYFSLDFSLEGGDVVVADQDLPGIGFKKSSKAYDGTVLGIVSTQPGLVLGDDSQPDKNAKPVQLALAGRVPVKVSTENGPIQVGDYLTSSSIPGVAMKATKAGPTVGKALEEWDESKILGYYDTTKNEYISKENLSPNIQISQYPNIVPVGKLMAFVNVSWYDPDALRNNLSDISVNLLDGTSFNLSPSKLYTVSSSLSGAIGRVGAFDQLALGSLTAGNISTDSLNVNHITVQGQDLTEILSSKVSSGSFEVSTASSSASLTAGDIVTTSKVGLDSFEVSQEPYDKNILGVSTNDKPPNNILLSGKTSVKVSTENGPIQVGDFLTSSATSGVAMKATRPGTVIGKALESYDNPDPHQVGTILIFVNVTFADPGNFLASLSLDEQGNMIIPKIRTSSLQIGPISQIGQIGTDGTQITTNSDPDYTSPGPNLASNTNSYIDLSGEIASLEDKIKSLESRVEELAQNTSGNVGIGTTAQVTGNRQQATESAQVATDSATVAYSLPPVASDLNLTPPDILYNTGSAVFTNLTVKSEATMSGQLSSYDLNVSNSLKSLGKTSLADTNVAGTLSVDGTLSIEQGKEINVLGTLYLQKTALASGIDIFNGKVTIDPAGNITTQGKIIASEVKTNKLTISNTPIATSAATLAASIGTATLPANAASVTIQTSQAYDSAKVFITPITNTDKTLSVTNIKNNESFDVSVLTPSTADINFNWWIVQTN